MAKNTKTLILTGVILTLTFVGSYINFSQYKPKTIKQVPDVKGLQSDRSDIPLPEGAEKIGVNVSSDAEQTTFHTNKSKHEIQAFYKNIFTSSKWQLESQGIHEDFIVARYKKGNETISVIAIDTKGDYKTLVNLETVNR